MEKNEKENIVDLLFKIKNKSSCRKKKVKNKLRRRK